MFKIMEKRKIELFTAGCPVCEPVVEMVNSMACQYCEITIYNLVEPCDTKECLTKIKEYNITCLPAVAVDGKLLDCCTGRNLSREELEKAGIAQVK
jgi:hypothetical protein